MRSSVALPKDTFLNDVLIAFAGSLIMVLSSKICLFLPGNPVPITMQTFGVFMTGLFLGPKRGALAVTLFLLEASAGVPVLPLGANPLWLFGPRAGYLLGFIFGAYAVGYFTQKTTKLIPLFCAFLIGDIILFSLGVLVLAFFVGFEHCLTLGLLPFMIGEAYKLTAATLIARGIKR